MRYIASLNIFKCLFGPFQSPMWQVTTIPEKLSGTLDVLSKYAQESINIFFCPGKARRKERDGDQNPADTKLYLEESVLERKLPDADLRDLVDLPAGLDYNEWLASHTLALFEHVNLVYGTISEFCTTSGCSDMTGPGNRTYLWFDEKGKKTRVAAPQYIDYVMTFTQKTVSDESIFPTKFANEFPSSFESIARKILRLQFHVIAHLYAAHFREIATLGLHTHLNLTFAHLTALHRRFNLIDEKETDVLRDLEIALRLSNDDRTTAATSTTTATSSTSTDGSTTTAGTMASAGITASSSSSGMTCSTTLASSVSTASTTTSSNQGTDITGSKILGNNTTTTSDDSCLIHHHHQQQTSSTTTTTTSLSPTPTRFIDGDATARPICTQPEAMRGFCTGTDLRDGSEGFYGNSSSFTNNNNSSINQTGFNYAKGSGMGSNAPSSSAPQPGELNSSSHIGSDLFGYSNTNVYHDNSSTHPIETTNTSLLQKQCNSNSSRSSNNAHTTAA